MSRNDFMGQLESLLQNISPAEREEALQYYNDYFDDAGPENEQAVIEALGNPARVAENIKKELLANGYGEGAYAQATASDRAVIAYGEDMAEKAPENGNNEKPKNPQSDKSTDNKASTGLIVLIVILCVLASPVLLGVTTGIFGLLTGILASWFALILGFGIAAVALLMVFLVLAAVAVLCIATEPLVSVALLGGGMICAGIGILFLMLTVAMAGIATPACFSGIGALCRKIFGNKKTTSVG